MIPEINIEFVHEVIRSIIPANRTLFVSKEVKSYGHIPGEISYLYCVSLFISKESDNGCHLIQDEDLLLVMAKAIVKAKEVWPKGKDTTNEG